MLSMANNAPSEIAAPWSLASTQMGLGREKVGELSPKIHAEYDAGEHVLKLWVYFTDKAVFNEDEYRAALDLLAQNYNPRAVERRRLRRGAPGLFDGHDLPLSSVYLQAVGDTGARIGARSRWLNAVSVHADRSQAERIASLLCVRAVRLVRIGKRVDRPSLTQGDFPDRNTDRDFYGQAQIQLEQINLPALHARGFTGQDVIIGVLDSGFRRDHIAFNHPEHPLAVVAEWDFVNDDPETGIEIGDDPDQHFHGTAILGAIASYAPQEMVGAAFDASYILAKVEDAGAEFPLEEDWFAAGLEFLEAEGCDVATSSLLAYWYGQDSMDGETSVMARAFNVATSNGMHCCQAAGNQGHDDDPGTSHLLTPADAFEVITCGAVAIDDDIAGFSSDGPTLDGRIKPEILGRGQGAWTVYAYDSSGYVTVSGTSIATPQIAGVIACLVQAHPDWNVGLMRHRISHTADYYLAHGTSDPLFVRGFGIVDAAAAEDSELGAPVDTKIAMSRPRAHPNPFRERCQISATLPGAGRLYLELFDVGGRRLRREDHGMRDRGSHGLVFEGRDLPNGVYPYRLIQEGRAVGLGKLLILR